MGPIELITSYIFQFHHSMPTNWFISINEFLCTPIAYKQLGPFEMIPMYSNSMQITQAHLNQVLVFLNSMRTNMHI